MTDGLIIGLTFLAPTLILFAWAVTRKPERRDWVAERHRQITHRGLKSRAGMRS
jgi:hypothetical protein